MRPAYMFAETAARFDSNIEVVKDDIRIDGKSVLSILTLGAAQGSQVHIEANGADAQDAVNALAELVSSGFVVERAQAFELAVAALAAQHPNTRHVGSASSRRPAAARTRPCIVYRIHVGCARHDV